MAKKSSEKRRVTSFRFDTFRLDKAEKLPNGGLKIPARISRTGIQLYTDSNGKMVREYRPPEEVFSQKTLDSFKGVVVTDLHPGEAASPRNFSKVAKGHLGDDIRRDGSYTAATVYVLEQSLIDGIESDERKELSAGYDVIIDDTPGTTPEGERFDRIQRRIVGNHVAIGPENWGRAGGEVSLRLDSNDNAIWAPEEPREKTGMKITIRVDGVDYTFEAPDNALQQALEKKHKADDAIRATLAKEKDALSGKADTLEKENKELKDKLSKADDPKRIDARVKERTDLETKAHKLVEDADFSGKTDREVMILALGGDKYPAEGKSDDYINGAFEAAASTAEENNRTDSKTDNREDSLDKARKNAEKTQEGIPESTLEKKLAGYYERRRDAYKQPLALTNDGSN